MVTDEQNLYIHNHFIKLDSRIGVSTIDIMAFTQESDTEQSNLTNKKKYIE